MEKYKLKKDNIVVEFNEVEKDLWEMHHRQTGEQLCEYCGTWGCTTCTEPDTCDLEELKEIWGFLVSEEGWWE